MIYNVHARVFLPNVHRLQEVRSANALYVHITRPAHMIVGKDEDHLEVALIKADAC